MYNLMHYHSSDKNPTILESFPTYLEAREALLAQVEYFTATLGTMRDNGNSYYTWHSSDLSWDVAVYVETVDGLPVDSHGTAITVRDLSQEALDYDENEVGPYSPDSFYGQCRQLDQNILLDNSVKEDKLHAIRKQLIALENELDKLAYELEVLIDDTDLQIDLEDMPGYLLRETSKSLGYVYSSIATTQFLLNTDANLT